MFHFGGVPIAKLTNQTPIARSFLLHDSSCDTKSLNAGNKLNFRPPLVLGHVIKSLISILRRTSITLHPAGCSPFTQPSLREVELRISSQFTQIIRIYSTMEKDKSLVLDAWSAYIQKDIMNLDRLALERSPSETPRTDHFNIKKVGFQTNKPLNWHDGRYTY